jgi:hypothetical protein
MESGTDLKLTGDVTLPRELWVRLNPYGYLVVSIYRRGSHLEPARSIAFIILKVGECHLQRSERGEYTLRVGEALFDVTQKEAAQMHATFAPLGLKSAFSVSP